MKNALKRDWPATSFLPGLKLTSFNGCRETDRPTMLANLKLANLSSVPLFKKWLRTLGNNERTWWQAIGWTEGFRYWHQATDGTHYLEMLRKDIERFSSL